MTSIEVQVVEGMIPFRVGNETFETYYKTFGEISQSACGPIVALHGGPGISHDVLIPIADLASQSVSTAVIFYDQLGSGRSTRLRSKDISFWTIDLFIAELENLLAFFKITDKYNIIGHSWGGTLTSEFIIRRNPNGLRRLVLSNVLASAKLRNEAIGRLRKQLPQEVQETLTRHEQAGTTKDAEYKTSMWVFWETFGCRVKPFPPEALYSMTLPEEDSTVLDAMRTGTTGLGSQWDITDKIYLMRHIPTLLINGAYDFMADDVCAPFYQGIDKVKWVKFANSSHMPFCMETFLGMLTLELSDQSLFGSRSMAGSK